MSPSASFEVADESSDFLGEVFDLKRILSGFKQAMEYLKF